MADELMRDLPGDLPTFLTRFGTDAQCRAYLVRARWPEGFRCAGCGHERAYSHRARLIEECAACGKQHSLLAGTIFAQTKTGLARWFLAIFLVTSSKGGISAMELQRQMGFGSYGTAWAWLHKIRRAMVVPGRKPLGERVEADETLIGGPRSGLAPADGLRQLRHDWRGAQSPRRSAARRARQTCTDVVRRATSREAARPWCGRQDRGRRRGGEAGRGKGRGRRLGRLRLQTGLSARHAAGRQPRRPSSPRPQRRHGPPRSARTAGKAMPGSTRPVMTTSRSISADPGAMPRCDCPASISSSASPSAGCSAPITVRSAPNTSRPTSTSTCSASTAAPPRASVTVSPVWSSRRSTPNPPPIAASSLRRHRPDGSG